MYTECGIKIEDKFVNDGPSKMDTLQPQVETLRILISVTHIVAENSELGLVHLAQSD